MGEQFVTNDGGDQSTDAGSFHPHQRAAIDLGLLTRVLCHELNNLIANQRGYARLLEQRGGLAGDAMRWLGELAAATDGLQLLLAGMQDWSRRAATPDGTVRPSPPWPSAAAVSLAAGLVAQGCAVPVLPLLRMLEIVGMQAGAGVDAWQPIAATAPPGHGGVLGTLDSSGEVLGLRVADGNPAPAAGDWAEAADRILPTAGAPAADWERALVLGLLRQCGGDLYLPGGSAPCVELWLPKRAAGLAPPSTSDYNRIHRHND
ncbi:MAG: hypothetical protein KGI67_07880 [Pseudomonadota bacterium]|nr:hypothetical protein [Pseudomonadota bacterium]